MKNEQRAMSKKILTFEDGSVYEGDFVDGKDYAKQLPNLPSVVMRHGTLYVVVFRMKI
jgi:hypothetical protein